MNSAHSLFHSSMKLMSAGLSWHMLGAVIGGSQIKHIDCVNSMERCQISEQYQKICSHIKRKPANKSGAKQPV